MKRIFWLFILIALIIGTKVLAQSANKTVVKSMLQGLWKVKGNDSITIAIAGDSALEYNLGSKDMGLYSCILSNKPCDNEVLIVSPTGYYLNIIEDGGNGICAALQLINNKEFRLLLDESHILIFEKMP